MSQPGEKNQNFSPPTDRSCWPPHPLPGLCQRGASGPWADLGVGARNCSSRRTAAIQHPWTCISGGPIGFPKVHHVPVSDVIPFEMSPRTIGLSLQGRTHSSQGCGLWLRPPAWPGVSPSNVRMGLLGLTLPGTSSCRYANRKRETELGHLLLSDSRSACECKARISADTHARMMHSSYMQEASHACYSCCDESKIICRFF